MQNWNGFSTPRICTCLLYLSFLLLLGVFHTSSVPGVWELLVCMHKLVRFALWWSLLIIADCKLQILFALPHYTNRGHGHLYLSNWQGWCSSWSSSWKAALHVKIYFIWIIRGLEFCGLSRAFHVGLAPYKWSFKASVCFQNKTWRRMSIKMHFDDSPLFSGTEGVGTGSTMGVGTNKSGWLGSSQTHASKPVDACRSASWQKLQCPYHWPFPDQKGSLQDQWLQRQTWGHWKKWRKCSNIKQWSECKEHGQLWLSCSLW